MEVISENTSGMKSYKLTTEGQKFAIAAVEQFSEQVKGYFYRLSEFVRSLSFPQLVSAIYKEYPDMKANSVFR